MAELRRLDTIKETRKSRLWEPVDDTIKAAAAVTQRPTTSYAEILVKPHNL